MKPLLPDANNHLPDHKYMLELLARANLSQRAAARLLGLSERAMRYHCSGAYPMPYLVQFALEVLAEHAVKNKGKS